MLTYSSIDNSSVTSKCPRAAVTKNGLAPNIIDARNRKIVDASWNLNCSTRSTSSGSSRRG